jgi:ribosome-binding protein aMBF1 (putative translation factor)
MKVKGIPFNQVKESLLNTPEAIRGYQEADKELALVEMLYEMREKAGLSKSALAERMGITPSAISRLEGTRWGPA